MDWDIHGKPLTPEERRRMREFHHNWEAGAGVVLTPEEVSTIKKQVTITHGAVFIGKIVIAAAAFGVAWVKVAKPWLGVG